MPEFWAARTTMVTIWARVILASGAKVRRNHSLVLNAQGSHPKTRWAYGLARTCATMADRQSRAWVSQNASPGEIASVDP